MKTTRLFFASLMACFLILGSLQAQSDDMISAFAKSYEQEYTADYSGAIATLKKVYDQDSYEINLRLGWLHYMAGLFTEGVSYYQRAINLYPYAIEAKLGFVYPASALGNWEQVITQYKAILKIDPAHTLTNYRMGLIYYGREDYETAYRYFERLVNLFPFDYDGLIMFAWTNLKLGKMTEAKVLFRKVLMLSPNDASALEGLGLIK
jgi:tetratricopeptide (TPR) repeat protein